MFLDALKRCTQYLDRLKEPDIVTEGTEIEGLHWIRTHSFKTSNDSRIMLPNPRQYGFTVVYHGEDFSTEAHKGYGVYGMHAGQDDVLTFLATDRRLMAGHFVDCRPQSKTYRVAVSLSFGGDPDRALVVPRGVAHIFDNLTGMVTLNQIRLFFDFNNPDFDPSSDVINVPRDSPISAFPAVRVNRIRAPFWLCYLAIKSRRLRLADGNRRYPFSYKIGGRRVSLIPK